MEKDEAWDSGELGREERYAKKSDHAEEVSVDDSLDLQLISIRLPKALIDDFKMLAKYHGVGYQPLMRDILKRFAEGEKRQIINDMIQKAASSQGANSQDERKCA